ncbi:hypothetical protein E6C27_scaffold271G002490 [Cucumis melo var. makuwa]|uniref:Uncharacterized protein n=1 Tax=Cucumis melo var. makuwa TaxID=1194695 RepID=A0A5A7VM57_CUCMM|nr:hypothetical protein E6C27_scaffold271G002490 [Cucumis melo var. makuwa]
MENSISPGPCRRQRGSHDTIRAGRYLCDKEFRYLRTIRVIAAVYRGFHSKLITLLLLTFQHWAGEHPFSRSYWVILLSSFDMVLSSALVHSTCSPVSVWGTTHDYGGTLSRDPYSKVSTGMRKACRLVRLNETFENESAHSQVPRKRSTNGDESFAFQPRQSRRAIRLGRVRKALMTQGESHGAGKESEGRGGCPRPDYPIRSNRQAWFCSQSYFVTFVYPSDDIPFGGSLGTDSLCVD